ncbi:hypothetical protein W59_03486 [Rhodococcus opacus RKJ300 = JCM 13270]|uniref:Uncharacterized protein n=2 Tax=Rhodococcus opacus TaxID=37919 RepID=C1BD29_RHOOB|nr:hypothetical protein W59_03486 [Rhodococcus opacus RKJ300 = JCM 13270]BAH55773.1 hypothetical protein ROP_pROB01-02740 [Rhodococcus opacus B4]
MEEGSHRVDVDVPVYEELGRVIPTPGQPINARNRHPHIVDVRGENHPTSLLTCL